MPKFMTTKEFITKANNVHNNEFTYLKTKYKSSTELVVITCKIHGDFKQRAAKHLAGHKCRQCAIDHMKSNTKEFTTKAKKVHPEYDYKYVNYIKSNKPVEIICKKHGLFCIRPNDLLDGNSCTKCGMESKKRKLQIDPEIWIRKAKQLHGKTYDYSKCKYVNAYTNVKLICKQHGEFEINPRAHAKGVGCKLCSSTRYSQISLVWIKEVCKENNWKAKDVLHAFNGGEYIIPNTKYRVDGFHPRTNTVLEFYGDNFHGNLEKYKPRDKCHPYLKNKTAKSLHNETIKREDNIRSLGYKVLSIWERDYWSSKDPISQKLWRRRRKDI